MIICVKSYSKRKKRHIVITYICVFLIVEIKSLYLCEV